MNIAYLIVAHNKFEILQSILTFLDSENADFYIFIDKKSKNYDIGKIKNCCINSKCFIKSDFKINWGGYSQIRATLSLLKETQKEKKYDYYHFISGVDFPIKTKEYIENFTMKVKKYNCIDFEDKVTNKIYMDRLKYYYFFQDVNISNKFIRKILYKFDNFSKKLQKLLGVNRLKDFNLEVKKGTNWFSINDVLVQRILDNQNLIEKMFKFTRCGDECFIQTLLYYLKLENTLYKTNVYNDSAAALRYIDWKRGSPYNFNVEDIGELLSTPGDCLFARKFLNITVINQLLQKITTDNNNL